MPDAPLILAFDTSAAHCAAALLSGGQLVGSVHEAMQRGQAESLMGICEALLQQHDVTYRDLTAIGVGVGPGNFTGVRISVSAARGLALGGGSVVHLPRGDGRRRCRDVFREHLDESTVLPDVASILVGPALV